MRERRDPTEWHIRLRDRIGLRLPRLERGMDVRDDGCKRVQTALFKVGCTKKSISYTVMLLC